MGTTCSKAVILDGVCRADFFDVREAFEKRFYMECRKIVAS
jgi:hypothetical protein